MKTQQKHQLHWLWLSALVLILDYLSKQWISHTLAGASGMQVASCLNFILTHNTGAAFSFLGGVGGWQRWFLIFVSLGVSIYLIFQLYKGGIHRGIALAMALIIGGALGNLYDRLVLGSVIDFIDFYLGHWHFATFNLADSAISLGAVLWIIISYRFDKRSSRQRW